MVVVAAVVRAAAVVADVVAAAAVVVADVEAKPVTRVGIGWRPEIALLVEEQQCGFVEIVAENFWNEKELPDALGGLVERGVTVIPHGVSLSLGGADEPDLWRLEKLASLAEKTHAPFVSEHIALVRGGGYESGHLLPVQRTREMLEIVIENVRIAQQNLPVPLVLENIATLSEWEGDEMSEAEFVTHILNETGAGLLLDVANLHANCFNHKRCHSEFLRSIPLEKIAYVHVAGGVYRERLYHDTHAHPLQKAPLAILRDLLKRTTPPAVLLERDDHFDDFAAIAAELQQIRDIVGKAKATA
jgi:uncharacterized protein (UPF0276 family)